MKIYHVSYRLNFNIRYLRSRGLSYIFRLLWWHPFLKWDLPVAYHMILNFNLICCYLPKICLLTLSTFLFQKAEWQKFCTQRGCRSFSCSQWRTDWFENEALVWWHFSRIVLSTQKDQISRLVEGQQCHPSRDRNIWWLQKMCSWGYSWKHACALKSFLLGAAWSSVSLLHPSEMSRPWTLI